MNAAQREIAKAERESLERSMYQQLTRYLRVRGLEWRQQYEFLPGRRYRADFAELTHSLIVEVQGGTWVHGRHSRGGGYENDCIRSWEASIAGWTVLPVTGGMVRDGRAILLVERWFRAQREREMERFVDEGMAEK